MSDVEYVHLQPNANLPELDAIPRKVIVVVDVEVTDEWQDHVSAWLIESSFFT